MKMQDVRHGHVARLGVPEPCDDSKLKLDLAKGASRGTPNMLEPNAVGFKSLVMVVAAKHSHLVTTPGLFDRQFTNPSLNGATESESYRYGCGSNVNDMQGLTRHGGSDCRDIQTVQHIEQYSIARFRFTSVSRCSRD
jgi:hypothetical protein